MASQISSSNEKTSPVIFPNVEPKSHHSRQIELQAFDDTKAGVKGLMDGGATVVPPLFVHPPQHLEGITKKLSNLAFQIPVIDLDGIYRDPGKYKEILNMIMDASQTWGFFQAINHGISTNTLQEMLEGVRRFHEQDVEIKKLYFTRDYTKKMLYNSNFDLYTAPAACWRDSINYIAAPDPPKPEELPEVCREILLRYSKDVMEFGTILFKSISEGLGLDQNHLLDIDCAQTLALLGHYYPVCPEPKRTLGSMKHSDYTFLTVLLQDNLGGLQVHHQGHWIDVVPLSGALVVNIGDLLQLCTDGSALGCPGDLACGGVARDTSGGWLFGFLANVGFGTILLAELWGLFYGLSEAARRGLPRLSVRSDSTVAIRLLRDGVDDNHPHSILVGKCRSLVFTFEICTIEHTYREGNVVADKMAHAGFNMPIGLHIYDRPPSWAAHSLLFDAVGGVSWRHIPLP